jgi:hypothetical protein
MVQHRKKGHRVGAARHPDKDVIPLSEHVVLFDRFPDLGEHVLG